MTAPRSKLHDLALVALTLVGWALPFGAALVAIFGVGGPGAAYGMAALTLAATVAAIAKGYGHVRAEGPGAFSTAYAALLLAWMPAWGLAVNHALLRASCERDNCSGFDAHRAFAEPWVAAPLALHVVTALGYAISRRRPERLRPAVEALVLSLMMVGALLHLAIGVQLGGGFLVVGLMTAPVGLPVIAPWLTIALYGVELRDRLRRRGAEEPRAPRDELPSSVYRHTELPDDETVPASMSRAWLARGAALSPAVLGAYGVLVGLTTRRATGAVMAFTQTCDHVFSTVPVRVVPHDCHYLCTVAARGHTWLVEPERVGVRNGVPIVVNRQLAVANAFEDLLHARWPRFGRRCREVYDRVGLPVSRYIRGRWMADAVYLAMKPFEWAFYAALLLLDPSDPEERVDRMYW